MHVARYTYHLKFRDSKRISFVSYTLTPIKFWKFFAVIWRYPSLIRRVNVFSDLLA
jgi:hypothetical protein